MIATINRLAVLLFERRRRIYTCPELPPWGGEDQGNEFPLPLGEGQGEGILQGRIHGSSRIMEPVENLFLDLYVLPDELVFTEMNMLGGTRHR